ncbi:MAG: class I tRNA ligase family protein, partial [Chlamydiia bacterium]|nr:class I tRNA ligase family protein [Chlamydiia bacterium]
DNMFPHHENEIAQSEAHSGKRFVSHWLHSEHLLVDNKKMSKSLGNFYTLRDLLAKGYKGKEVRYMLLHTHYKTQLNFTLEGLEGARQSLARLNALIDRLQHLPESQEDHPELEKHLKKAEEQFGKALADDLNISVALAALFDMVRDVNSAIDSGVFSAGQAQKTLDLLKRFDSVLAVMTFEQDAPIPQEILDAFEQRMSARAGKNWAEADRLRAFIETSGYVIEDSPAGSRVKRR